MRPGVGSNCVGGNRRSFRGRTGRGQRPHWSGSRALAFLLAATLTSAPVRAQTPSQRGDVDCSGGFSAADVVASTRALQTAGACDNDDCDRDGTTTAADIACTARCLFGVCSVAPHAPRVTAVVSDGTGGIGPFSTVRITGVNFGDPDDVLHVRIGGAEAEIVEVVPPDTVVVVVPALAAGVADVVVSNDELEGFAEPLTIEPTAPIGQLDTLADTFTLLDTAFERFLALDLSSLYGDDTEMIRAQIVRSRAEITADLAALLADPDFTTEDRAFFDTAFESSGTAEQLRALIADLALLASGEGGGGAQTLPAIARNFPRTIRVVAGVAQAAATGAASIPPVAIAIGTGVAIIGGILIAANDPLTPIITALRFRDSQDRLRRFPTAGGTVEIEGARFDSFSTGLAVTLSDGRQTIVSLEVRSDGVAVASLGNFPGLCGAIRINLSRTVVRIVSNTVPTRIQPELLGVDPNRAKPLALLNLATRGVSLCGASVRFDDNGGDHDFQVNLAPILGDVHQLLAPDTQPGFFSVSAQVGPLLAEEERQLEITNGDVTGLQLSCDKTSLELAEDMQRTNCTLMALPSGVVLPRRITREWASDSAALEFLYSSGDVGFFKGVLPGTAQVTVSITTGGRQIKSNAVTITVTDETAPRVTLGVSSTTVDPGDSVAITVSAEDLDFVTRLVLRAEGDGVEEAEQEFPCTDLEESCERAFTLKIKRSGFQQHTIKLTAEAFDGSGNKGVAEKTLRIKQVETVPPVVMIQAPQNGGRVRAGDTVQISVRLTDNQMGDTGVASVRVEATGAAVASGPTPSELMLPMPLPQATRLTSFTVKSAQELTGISNRSIVITATGFDGSGNMATDTVTVTAGGAPIITSIFPSPASAGSNIRIVGDGFGEEQGSSMVTIGGTASPLAVWSNTEVLATIPDEASGMITVVVTVDGVASNAFPLTVLGSGDVQITLVWDDTNDLDLHVTDPNGEEIFYNHTSSASGGRLDVDANAGCSGTTSSPRENIFWPTGLAPTGTYTVTVVYFKGCGDPPVPSSFTLNAIVDGRFMTLIEGSIGSGTRSSTFTR